MANAGEIYASIDHSARHMLKIVNSILDFTHLSRNASELRQEIYNVGHLVNNCIRSVVTKTEVNRIEVANGDVEMELTPFGPKEQYRCAGAAIHRVLVNLINNALQYGGDGQVVITFGGKDYKEERWLFISVRDYGPGIPSEFREKIFEPFSHVSESMNHQHEGLGLGLAFCEKLARLSHGRVYYNKPKDGDGAVFCFEVPIHKVHSPWGHSIQDRSRIRSFRRKSFEIPRVLLVENNFQSGQYLKDLIHAQGIDVDNATNGVEAISMFEQNSYDLVLLDLELPIMDGVEAASKIRKFEKESHPTPIIGMTTYSFEQGMSEQQKAAFSDFMKNPISPEQLREICHQWIGRAPFLPERKHDEYENDAGK